MQFGFCAHDAIQIKLGGVTVNHMNHDVAEVNNSKHQILPGSFYEKSLGTRLKQMGMVRSIHLDYKIFIQSQIVMKLSCCTSALYMQLDL